MCDHCVCVCVFMCCPLYKGIVWIYLYRIVNCWFACIESASLGRVGLCACATNRMGPARAASSTREIIVQTVKKPYHGTEQTADLRSARWSHCNIFFANFTFHGLIRARCARKSAGPGGDPSHPRCRYHRTH